MTAPQITVEFDAPLSTDTPEVFDAKAQDTGNKLNALGTQANAISTFVNDKATQVDADATAAASSASAADASATAAASASGDVATDWVSGGSYTRNKVVWLGSTGRRFRALTTHSGVATSPDVDGTNWVEATTVVKTINGDSIAGAGNLDVAATLADQAADSALPATGKQSIAGLLQTVRNALKWLTAKFDAGGDVDIKWDVPAGSTNAIVLTDRGKAVTITANTSIPTNASVPFPEGSAILLIGDATGRVITGPAASSLTLEGVATAKTSFTMKPNKSCVIRKTGTNTWRVFGDVTA